MPSQTKAKSSSPAAAPPARSAIAARFTSFSISTGVCSTSLSPSSTPSCQVGRFTASRGAPVRGSSTPGLPITTEDRVSELIPAFAHASPIASRTRPIGSSAPCGSMLTSAT